MYPVIELFAIIKTFCYYLINNNFKTETLTLWWATEDRVKLIKRKKYESIALIDPSEDRGEKRLWKKFINLLSKTSNHYLYDSSFHLNSCRSLVIDSKLTESRVCRSKILQMLNIFNIQSSKISTSKSFPLCHYYCFPWCFVDLDHWFIFRIIYQSDKLWR